MKLKPLTDEEAERFALQAAYFDTSIIAQLERHYDIKYPDSYGADSDFHQNFMMVLFAYKRLMSEARSRT